MAIGEGANFTAYAFVPASLVTPLGALSVLVTAILASYFLNEKLNLLGKMSCLLCLLGSTITVLHAPEEGKVDSLDELAEYLAQPAFVAYLLFVITLSTVSIFWLEPKYGATNVFVYITICSVIGSLSVMAAKGVGLAIVRTWSGEANEFTNGLTYVALANMVVCIAVQMNYLNKALDTYNTSVVSPIYYVFFTTFVMIASGILYGEFSNMTWFNIVGLVCGFATTIVAVFMLHLFKDLEIGLSDVTYVLGPMSRSRYDIDMDTSNANDKDDNGQEENNEFDRGFASAFWEDTPLMLASLDSEQAEPGGPSRKSTMKPLSREAAAALANEKWKRKKQKHVSFYGSVSDIG